MEEKKNIYMSYSTGTAMHCTYTIRVVCGSAWLSPSSELMPEPIHQLQLRAGAVIYSS
jgi:hypothetical protein